MGKSEDSVRLARLAVRLSNLASGVLIVLVVAYAAYSWNRVNQRELREMQSLATVMSRSLDVYFTSKQANLLFLAQSLARLPGGYGNLEQVQRELAEYKRYRDDTVLVALVRSDGQLLASSNNPSIKNLPTIAEIPAYQEFLKEYREDQPVYIGRPVLGLTTGQWGFSIRRVLRDKQGRAFAHLNMVISTDFVRSFWDAAPTFKTGAMTLGVLRDDGYLIGRHPVPENSNPAEVYGNRRTGALMKHLEQSGFPPQGVVTGKNAIVGSTYVNAYQRMEHFPITVFVAQAQAGIFNAWLFEVAFPVALVFLFIIAVRTTASRLLRTEQSRLMDRQRSEDEIAKREREQRFLIDRMQAGLVVHDGQGRVLRCNAEATRILRLSFEQMTGKELVDPAWKFLREDGTPMPLEEYPVSRALLTRAPVNDLVVGITDSEVAGITWVYCRADPWLDEHGSIGQVVVTFIDITTIKDMDQALQDKEVRFRALFENSIDAVLLKIPDGHVYAANAAACRLYGMSEAQLKALDRNGLFDPGDPALNLFLAQRAREGRAFGSLTSVRADGSRFKAEVSSSVFSDSKGQRYISMIVRDVTERESAQAALEAANRQMRSANEQLIEMAHYDVLTHLPNRTLLTDRMQQAMAHSVRRERSVAIAFLDLDGFKDINDHWGHETGDRFLVELSRHMKAVLREGDTLARLGGDEFVAVLTDLGDEHDCEPMLMRLLRASAQVVVIDDHPLKVTASIGVTIFPKDGASPDELLRHADQAMYMAKQAGKNRYHLFDVASDAAVRNRRAELHRIERGVRSGEFVLFYQPQVNMRTGEVVGLEALIRWQHPDRGLLPPGLFLPLIEDDDIAIEVGGKVIELTLGQMVAWQAMGLNLRVGVNIFARQLQDPRFVDDLREKLEQFPGLDPSALELEVVETSALLDIEEVSRIMRSCAELGVQFALDDFGTGYSSLTYLKRLPANLLKIDQSFVRDMLEDPDDLAIIEGVIGLAHAFGRKVIAEGVETVEHASRLLAKGCELGQGYGIARPMPAADLPQWLVIWKARQPWVADAFSRVV